MRNWFRKWWPVLKILLTIAIVVAVGRQFARDLERPELWKQRSFRPDWLLLSAILYVFSLGLLATYWYCLLRSLGQHPPFWAAVRAHYIGQLGKYLPGKAWALVLRVSLVRDSVRWGPGILTSFYEVFTSMAVGVLLAGLLFGLFSWMEPAAPISTIGQSLGALRGLLRSLTLGEQPPAAAHDAWVPALICLFLWVPLGMAVLPPLFNGLAGRFALPFRSADAAPLPRIRLSHLIEGIILTTGSWLAMGASLWSMLHAIGVEQPWTWETWGRNTACVGSAYVAGFVAFFLPSGVGVREFFLTLFLAPALGPFLDGTEDGGRFAAVVAVILLRLVWTGSELVMVALLYKLPLLLGGRRPAASKSEAKQSVQLALPIQDQQPLS
jgi:uncharacterized membrane protein YbhN (UPF0104 family)